MTVQLSENPIKLRQEPLAPVVNPLAQRIAPVGETTAERPKQSAQSTPASVAPQQDQTPSALMLIMAMSQSSKERMEELTAADLMSAIRDIVRSSPELSSLQITIGGQTQTLGGYVDQLSSRALDDRAYTSSQILSGLGEARLSQGSGVSFAGNADAGSDLLSGIHGRFRLTSGMGVRGHPVLGVRRDHDGVDYGTPIGTDLRAGADARVVFAGRAGGYGNVVILDFGNGVMTLSAHLDNVKVQVGDVVQAGQVYAETGNTGVGTGAHLHFEVIINRGGRLYNIDPAAVMTGRVNPFDIGDQNAAIAAAGSRLSSDTKRVGWMNDVAGRSTQVGDPNAPQPALV
jgi:murein DD-endopeptidase MepM/ murein hydrolase activator NlpD